MQRLTDPRRIARRRLHALASQIPEALAGRIEGVHQARVASRRLRELLPLFAVDPELDSAVRKLRNRVRRLTRGLGLVRELDVASLTLDGVRERRPELADAVGVVRDAVEGERVGAVASLRDALESLDVDRFAARVLEIAGGLVEPAMRRRMGAALAIRIGDRGRALRSTIENAGTVYAPDRLHQIRIALKKYRYALELAEGLGRYRLRGTIGRLKSLQDLLGSLHDLEVLAARVRDCGADEPDIGCQQALTALARFLDEEIRRLHSEFLVAREALTVVFFWARRVRLRLGAAAVRMKRSPAPKAGDQAPGGPIAAAV